MVRKLATNFHNWTVGVYDEQLVGAQNQTIVESGLSYAKNIVSDNRGSIYPRQGTKPLMRLGGESVLIPYTVLQQKNFLVVGHDGIKILQYDNQTLFDPIAQETPVSAPTFTSTKSDIYWQSSDGKFWFYGMPGVLQVNYNKMIPYQQGNYTDPFSRPNSDFSFITLTTRTEIASLNALRNKTSTVSLKFDSPRKADINLYLRHTNAAIVGGTIADLHPRFEINSLKGVRSDGVEEDVEYSLTSTQYSNGTNYHFTTPEKAYTKYTISFTCRCDNYGETLSDAITFGIWLENIVEYTGTTSSFLSLSYAGDLTKLRYAQTYTDMILVGNSDFTPQVINLTGLTLSISNFSPTGLNFATTGNPCAVDIYQNRIVLAGFSDLDYQQMVAISEFSNAKQASTNFTVPNPPTATSALQLYQNKMRYPITQVFGGDKALYVLSADGISYINDIGTNGSPTFKIRNHEQAGYVKPIVKDDVLIYTDDTREKIFMVDYDLLVERYKVFDISAISKNLLSKKIKEMYYLPNRDRLIYILFDDGTMAAFLFDNNLNMRGFYPIETNGRIYDVCVHPDANELFLVVERANNYYIEVIEERPFINYNHAGDDDYQREFLTWLGNNTKYMDFESRDMWRDRMISEDGLFFQYNAESEYLIPADITQTYDNGLVTDGTIDQTIDCGLVTDGTISDTYDNGNIGELVVGYSAIVSNCSQTLFDAMEVGETYLFFDGQTDDKTKGIELTLLDKVWALDGTTAIFIFDDDVDEGFLYPAALKKVNLIENQPQLPYWAGNSGTVTNTDIMGSSDLVLQYQVILDGMYIGNYDCSFEAGEPFISHPNFWGYFQRIGLAYEKHAKMSYIAPMSDQKLITELSVYLLATQDLDVGVNGGFQNITKFCTDGYYDYPNRLYQGEYSIVVDNNTEVRKDIEVKTDQPFGFEILAISATTDYGDWGGN